MRFSPLLLALIFSGTTALAQFEPGTPPPPPQNKPVNPIKVFFDCHFADNTQGAGTNPINIDCADIGHELFAADRLIEKTEKGQSEIDAFLTERLDGSYEQYSLQIRDHTGSMVPDTTTWTTPGLRQLATLTPPTKRENLEKEIIKLLEPYHAIKSYTYNPEGNMVIQVTPRLGSSTPIAQKTSPIYVSASGFGMLINQGNSVNIMAMPSITAGYTDIGPDHQGILIEYANATRYNYISATVPVTVPKINPKTGQVMLDPVTGKPLTQQENQTETGSNLNFQNGLVLAKSLNKHWAIATFIRYNQDPSSNTKEQYQGHVGIEYELLPFLLVNDNALTVNYLIGGNHNLYYTPNTNNQMIQNIATHAISFYYVYHFNRLDLTGSVAATSTVNDFKQWGIGGQLGGRVYLNKKKTFTFDPSINLGFKQNLVNNPGNPGYQYELLQLMGVGTNSTPQTFTVRVGFSYRLGPNLLRQKDTRWQFTSDEVPNGF